MKNLHLISAVYTSKGHSKEYIHNLTKHLSKTYNISLFVASRKHIALSQEHFTIVPIPVEYSETSAEYFQKYSFLAPYVRACLKQLRSYQYYKTILRSGLLKKEDLVYIMDYDVFPLHYLVKSLNKLEVKTFLWVHSARFKSKDIVYRIYKYLFKFLFNKYIVFNTKKIIVNSNYIKYQLVEILKVSEEKVEAIQYPSQISYSKIDKQAARSNLGFSRKESIILFFGMLRKDKNLRLLIESASLCKNDVKLIIAGSEASVTKDELLEWINFFKLKDVHLDINYISEEKMALYYSCSDVLILTYHAESSSQSGPLSLAREFDLPTIVTNAGELGHYVQMNEVGLVTSQNSAKGFSETIDRFFNLDRPELKKILDNIRITQKKYSWSAASKIYQQIFDEA